LATNVRQVFPFSSKQSLSETFSSLVTLFPYLSPACI
jgi:hypothetical protein